LLQESLTEFELADDSLCVQAPECVGVNDAHIHQPPGEGRPVLHTPPLHSIVLPELINCIHMTLANIVVEAHLWLGDSSRMIRTTTILSDRCHVVDSMMCAEHPYNPCRVMVKPQQTTQLTTLPCPRLTLPQRLHCFHQVIGEVAAVGSKCPA